MALPLKHNHHYDLCHTTFPLPVWTLLKCHPWDVFIWLASFVREHVMVATHPVAPSYSLFTFIAPAYAIVFIATLELSHCYGHVDCSWLWAIQIMLLAVFFCSILLVVQRWVISVGYLEMEFLGHRTCANSASLKTVHFLTGSTNFHKLYMRCTCSSSLPTLEDFSVCFHFSTSGMYGVYHIGILSFPDD